MSIILAFEQIEHRDGQQQVLHDISLQVKKSQIVCILGAAGSGKSKILRMAAGLERPHAGRVLLQGQLVADAVYNQPPEKRNIGLVFQDNTLFPHLTVEENIAFGLQHLPLFEQQARIHLWLRRLTLLEQAQTYPYQLSNNEQQRVALARALAPQPALLLLDEPFANLDTFSCQQLRDELLAAAKEFEFSILLATHNPEEALYMGDWIAVMEKGEIIQQDIGINLYRKPQNPHIAYFFGFINRFTAKVQNQQVTTPVGTLPASHLPEGSIAQILIRAEALQPCYADIPQAVITAVHHFGRISVLRLNLLPDLGFNWNLQIHTLGYSTLQVGDEIGLQLDKELAFVFADKD